MPNITLTRKDGTTQKFEERGRSGGSWVMTLTFKDSFAIITDEWGKKTAIPSEDIKEIVEDAPRSSW